MGFVKEFKEFAMKGNVMDMAVGVIIGGAFGKIVSSLVDDVLMPIIGMLTGGVDFNGLVATVGDAQVKYGTLAMHRSSTEHSFRTSSTSSSSHSVSSA